MNIFLCLETFRFENDNEDEICVFLKKIDTKKASLYFWIIMRFWQTAHLPLP